MGQQQLLLVILVTIIVGIATVVAINTFSSQAESANVDAARQDVLSVAASAQQYFMKPEMMDGGGNSFSGLSFNDIGFSGTIDGDQTAYNQNGTYILGSGSDTGISITAHPSSCEGYTQGSASCDEADQLTATIEQDDISWTN